MATFADIKIKVSPEKMWWACVKDGHNCAVKSFPEKLAKVWNDGDSFGEVGSVRTIHFHKGAHPFDVVKAKVVEVDEEKLFLKMDFIDGDFEGTFSNDYIVTLHFLPGVIKCTFECKGKPGGHFLEDVKEFVYHMTIKKIEGFVLANEG